MESKPSLSSVETRKSQEFNYPAVQFERAPNAVEQETGVSNAVETTTPTVLMNAVSVPSLPEPIQATSSSVDDHPLIAGDDDLIEKEWVEKAKSIIAETKDDPYRREREVGRLQVDYLKKRYGRELGGSQ